MKVTILAVGRLRAGPEAALVSDYATRFSRTGRPHGLGPMGMIEVDDRKGSGMLAEGDLLLRAIPERALVVVLDERGEAASSPELAGRLGRWRDSGWQEVVFLIGGADGHAPAVRHRADYMISFGRMVWPHMLVRVMLAEQLYRSATILAGAPYHRA